MVLQGIAPSTSETLRATSCQKILTAGHSHAKCKNVAVRHWHLGQTPVFDGSILFNNTGVMQVQCRKLKCASLNLALLEIVLVNAHAFSHCLSERITPSSPSHAFLAGGGGNTIT